jgi:integrase
MSRDHGDGGIDARGKDRWRLRYRVGGKRFTKTVRGSITDAKRELRAVLKSGDDGGHVEPKHTTLGQWIDTWLELRRPKLAARTLERYAELLRLHVKPTLGDKRVQAVTSVMLDKLYQSLRDSGLSEGTVRYVHVVLGSCLRAAQKKKLITFNPKDDAEAPATTSDEEDGGQALEQEQLTTLVSGFRESPLFPIVAVAAYTGARRGEILALRWTDLDADAKTLRIERAIEDTKAHGLRFKEPKTKRGRRTVMIDDGLIALLVTERQKYQRIIAGVPDGQGVDFSLIKLPADTLMFPPPPAPGANDLNLATPRRPRSVTKEFSRKAAKLGFPSLRFKDLRSTHETLLLDAGVPVHVVAARGGHDPAILLRNYAKRTRKADTSAAAVISGLSKGALRGS